MTTMVRPMRWALLTCACTLACTPAIKVGDLDTDGSSTGSSVTDTTGGPTDATGFPSGTGTAATDGDIPFDVAEPDVPPSEVRKMDILLVVDNSGSMGARQVQLVDAAIQFTSVLDAPGIEVDWRLAITTTDNGNPWCQGTGPEGGDLVASSCRSRLNDFIFEGATPVDVTAQACTDLCSLEQLPLQPSGTFADPDPRLRPWISGSCDSNVEDGFLQDALRCAIPQGISGCGFEQPLESMRKAIVRSRTAGEDAFGFIRNDAHLVVVFLSDEADCSHNADFDSIFLPDGERAFWDNDWASPTSALCWRAGVACTGDPSAQDCQPSDYDVFGEPADPSNAVLHPLSRYQDVLAEVQADKAPGAGVFMLGILGTPIGGGPPLYADSTATDPQHMESFGIGPGCQNVDGTAVPPVRMLQLVNGYPAPGGGNSSVCDSDYGDTVEAITSIVGAGVIESDQVCPVPG